jgi:hypothetical protein
MHLSESTRHDYLDVRCWRSRDIIALQFRDVLIGQTVRRFSRWLNNNQINPQPLYGPWIEPAVVGWVGKALYIALDAPPYLKIGGSARHLSRFRSSCTL